MACRRKRQVLVECREYPGRCRHHMTPKAKGGDRHPSNLVLLSLDHHAAYHRLFGNLSWEQAIELMIRVHRRKGRCLYGAMGKPCNLAPCLDTPKVQTNGNGHKKNGHRPGRQVFKMIR
jgi:hypothetical protein